MPITVEFFDDVVSPGTRPDTRQDTITALLAMHERRVTELITHANALEEMMRAEKRRADAAESALLALARVSGQLAIIKLREP